MGNFNRDFVRAEQLDMKELFLSTPGVRTLSGAYTVQDDSPTNLLLDPGGASRAVTLPDFANAEGKVFSIFNTADVDGEMLNLLDENVAAVASIAPGGNALIGCFNGAYRLLSETTKAAALTSGAGDGINNNTGGGSYSSEVTRDGEIITTRIFIDVDGLDSSTTDLDVIGFDEATDQPAYIGQITTAQNGLIFEGSMACVETPAGGVTTVDLYASPEGDNVFSDVITDDTGEHALVTASGAWAAGGVQSMTTLPLPDEYLYLTGGAAGTAAEYTAGQFVITLKGWAQ